MPRKKFYCDPSTPYHLVARSNNRDWFNLPIEQAWDTMCKYLYFIHHAYGVHIHAFVLMENHFHLIATFPKGNLSASMEYFLRETSKRLGYDSNRINHVYGSRLFRSRLGSFHYYMNTYKYVFQNPLRVHQCKVVEDYRYSSLHGILGKSHLLIPIAEDTLLFENPLRVLNWLNKTSSPENVEAVRKALRREDFSLPRCSKTKRAHRLEQEPL